LKEETIKKVEEDIKKWAYLAKLPTQMAGFSYQKNMTVEDDIYLIFSYENSAAHCTAAAYYHEETKEYKLRVQIGLTKFCRIECITPNIIVFERQLQEHLQKILIELTTFDPKTISSIVHKKNIMTWEYGKSLPPVLDGFERFISPDKPLKITNGSYIILDYSDFSIESNFTLYYNIFRDEFFGEGSIYGVLQTNYLFDTNELSELSGKLQHHLVTQLQDIRQKALMQKR